MGGRGGSASEGRGARDVRGLPRLRRLRARARRRAQRGAAAALRLAGARHARAQPARTIARRRPSTTRSPISGRSCRASMRACCRPGRRCARRRPPRRAAPPPPPFDLALHERALVARVRAELHGLVRALAAQDWEAAAASVRADPDDVWDADRIAHALAPFLAEYGRLDFTPDARLAHRTRIDAAGPRRWRVAQVLVDPAGDELWAVHGDVDLSRDRDPGRPARAAPAHRALSPARGRRPDTLPVSRRIRCARCCSARRRHSRCALPLDLRAGRAARSPAC